MNTNRRRNSWLNLVSVVALIVTTVPIVWSHDVEVVSTSTPAGRLAVFDDVWTTIEERYYDPGFNGVDWSAQRNTFRQLAANAESPAELYAVLRQMIGTLNDPHTRVFAPEEKFDWWRPRFISIGISVKEIDGTATVVQVEPNSKAAKAGIKPGDVIDSLDGKPLLSLINQRLKPNSTPASRARAFATVFDGPPGSVANLVWRDKRNVRHDLIVQRTREERNLNVRFKSVNNYSVIEIDAFTKPIAMTFLKDFESKTKHARGIIVDLRNNGGGDAQAMAEIAAAFLGPNINLGLFADRAGGGFGIFTSMLSAQSFKPVRVPVIVLTNERTSSAAEIFVAALRKAGTATVLGTRTCGCVLAIRSRHELPDGGVLDVSEMDYKTPAGEHLEGNGIQPDEQIVVHRQDLYLNRDPVVDAAIRHLKSRLN